MVAGMRGDKRIKGHGSQRTAKLALRLLERVKLSPGLLANFLCEISISIAQRFRKTVLNVQNNIYFLTRSPEVE
jgi:hypothetical protein